MLGNILQNWKTSTCSIDSGRFGNLVILVDSIELVKLVSLVDPVKSIGLVDQINLINWFSISKPKYIVRMALTKVYILAPSKSFDGSFCCMSLIASLIEHWSFSSSCQSAKLLFLKGFFSLNTTFLSIWLQVCNCQDHVDNNVFLFRCNRHYLFPKHCLSCPYEDNHRFYVQWNCRWNNDKWWNQICSLLHDIFCY